MTVDRLISLMKAHKSFLWTADHAGGTDQYTGKSPEASVKKLRDLVAGSVCDGSVKVHATNSKTAAKASNIQVTIPREK